MLISVALCFEILAGNINSVKDACLLLGAALVTELFEGLRSAAPSDDVSDAFYVTFLRVPACPHLLLILL